MTHYTVLVCLKNTDGKLNLDNVRSAVDEALAPYDENIAVPPRRYYEEGGPEDYWLYKSLKASNEKEKLGDLEEKTAKEAALFRTLPEPVTWDALRDVAGIVYEGDTEDFPVADEEDPSRAYTVTTYNPLSKWDWWDIGGRWGGYFPFRQEFGGEVITPERKWSSPEKFELLTCDGGPKKALDLDLRRRQETDKAVKTWQKYHDLVDHLPEAKPWKHFVSRVETEPEYTIDQARTDYRSQLRVLAVEDTDFRWSNDSVADYAADVQLHAERARAQAVPGYALLTADGRWLAPGNMGWFASSDDTEDTRAQYLEVANAYIDTLDDEDWLVLVDCHI